MFFYGQMQFYDLEKSVISIYDWYCDYKSEAVQIVFSGATSGKYHIVEPPHNA